MRLKAKLSPFLLPSFLGAFPSVLGGEVPVLPLARAPSLCSLRVRPLRFGSVRVRKPLRYLHGELGLNLDLATQVRTILMPVYLGHYPLPPIEVPELAAVASVAQCYLSLYPFVAQAYLLTDGIGDVCYAVCRGIGHIRFSTDPRDAPGSRGGARGRLTSSSLRNV